MRGKMTKKRIPKEFFIVLTILFVIGVIIPISLNATLNVDLEKVQEDLITKTWRVEGSSSILSFMSDGRVVYQGSGWFFHLDGKECKSSDFELEQRMRDKGAGFICDGHYAIGGNADITIEWNSIVSLTEPAQPVFTPSELKSFISIIYYHPKHSPRMTWGGDNIFEKNSDAPSYGDPIIPIL